MAQDRSDPAQQLADRGCRNHMTELEQLAADADAAPFRVVPSHLQNQRPKLWIETWSARTLPAAEGRPLSAHQLARPSLAVPASRPKLPGLLGASARP